jgi:hypothetical protein
MAPALRGVFTGHHVGHRRNFLVKKTIRLVWRRHDPRRPVVLGMSLRHPHRVDRYRTQDSQSTFPQISHVLLLLCKQISARPTLATSFGLAIDKGVKGSASFRDRRRDLIGSKCPHVAVGAHAATKCLPAIQLRRFDVDITSGQPRQGPTPPPDRLQAPSEATAAPGRAGRARLTPEGLPAGRAVSPVASKACSGRDDLRHAIARSRQGVADENASGQWGRDVGRLVL